MSNKKEYTKSIKIGGLWLKKSREGQSYMNGSIDLGDRAFYVSIFKNNNKREGSNDPDYNILKGEEKQPYVKPVRQSNGRAVPKIQLNETPKNNNILDDEDVPF